MSSASDFHKTSNSKQEKEKNRNYSSGKSYLLLNNNNNTNEEKIKTELFYFDNENNKDNSFNLIEEKPPTPKKCFTPKNNLFKYQIPEKFREVFDKIEKDKLETVDLNNAGKITHFFYLFK